MASAKGNLAFMFGGGEAGAVMRNVDWSKTPLGPVESWSHALRTTVSTLLHSRHPMFLWWGPELIQLYNDAYRPSFGTGKHPAAMGQRGADCWQEIWPIIWPQIEGVMSEGTATYHEDQLVPIRRNGRIEEVFWTYGYSPVRDDDGTIGGCLVVCTETTGRALAERRMASLQSLTQRTAVKTDMSSVIAAAAQTLEEQATQDVMFALFHVGEQRQAPIRSVGLDEQLAQRLSDFLRPSLKLLAGTRQTVSLPPELQCESRVWREPVEQVVVERFGEVDSYLVFGLSPRLSYDKAYADYLAQLAGHVTASGGRVTAFHARLLVESERNNLLMQAPVATALLTGPDLVFQLANPKCIELVGGRQLVGKGFLEAFPESAGTPLAEVLFNTYHTGQRYSADELCVPLKPKAGDDGDGESKACYFTVALEPLRAPSGEAYGLMAVAGDITAQVRARKELETTQSELLKASRAKDEFLAMLGHELRNPLSPIMTALELMRLRNIKEGAEERAVIERQLRHVVALVDDLLDVARITRGELTLQRSRVALGDVVRRAIEQASPLLEQGEHRLDVHIDDTLFVDADPNRLAQVVSNLLTNAAKYTNRGGSITVHAERADEWRPSPGASRETARQLEGDAAWIRVVDTGIGLAKDDPARLFDTFQRGGRSSQHGGLGLGLAIVKSLVVAHGGEASLHSEGLGRGTEARVLLPLAKGPTAEARESAPHPAGRSVARRRVLLVDDNEDAAMLLSMALSQLGHDVRTVNDGAAALRLADTYVPEIALLDLGMPVMNGFELAAQLQQRPGWEKVRFVAVTGYGQASDRERTRAAGFSAHVVKPIQARAIDEQIRSLVPLAEADDERDPG